MAAVTDSAVVLVLLILKTLGCVSYIGISRKLTEHQKIQLKSENNDYGTEHMLKGIIFQYEEMADRLEHYLAKESLERSITSN
jgi:hypothetical protein